MGYVFALAGGGGVQADHDLFTIVATCGNPRSLGQRCLPRRFMHVDFPRSYTTSGGTPGGAKP